jgi:hypothetical protein
MLVRHPWLSPLAGRFLNIGPNYLAFSRVVQQVIRKTGLPVHRLTGAISAVFQFVYGYGTLEGHFYSRVTDTGMTPDEYFRSAVNEVTKYPGATEVIRESTEIMEARGGDTVQEMMERDFQFALDLLVAGIEAMVKRADD